MFRTKKNHAVPIIFAVTLAVILAGMLAVTIRVRRFNAADRTAELTADAYNGSAFSLPDFDVLILPRGGDSGAWLKDPIYDDAGNELHGKSVGTIYEMTLINTTEATISDWTFTLYMPEQVWINNAWNGLMELHQSGENGMAVQTVDLREYTREEITLDYYIDHTGPMIPLYEGDFFVYQPNQEFGEMPIAASDPKTEDYSSIMIGFILYIPDQPLDYIATLDRASFNYHLSIDLIDQPLFKVLIVALGLWALCVIIAIVSQMRVRRLLERQKRDSQIIEQSMSTLINFVEAKDPSTKGHSLRVAQYSRLIAEAMGYSEAECLRIYYIALMHDCGKVSVSRQILGKPAALTDDEFEEIKNHTVYGSKMLRNFTSIDEIGLGAMYHHERYDGGGYPTGIAGDSIPKIARIICVADSLDAMNTDRLYRSRLPRETIIAELEANRGKQFDPQVVDILLRLIDAGKVVIGRAQEAEE